MEEAKKVKRESDRSWGQTRADRWTEDMRQFKTTNLVYQSGVLRCLFQRTKIRIATQLSVAMLLMLRLRQLHHQWYHTRMGKVEK